MVLGVTTLVLDQASGSGTHDGVHAEVVSVPDVAAATGATVPSAASTGPLTTAGPDAAAGAHANESLPNATAATTTTIATQASVSFATTIVSTTPHLSSLVSGGAGAVTSWNWNEDSPLDEPHFQHSFSANRGFFFF